MAEEVTKPFTLTRRSFVGASAVVGGIAVAGPLVACSAPEPAAEASVTLTINGEKRTVAVDNRTSLLDMLRERAGLTGTKKGCNQGACGACTVLLNGRRVNSCLTLAVMHDGAEITTIEGLAKGDQLHPLQQAFIDQDAFQCGYCTPGQIVLTDTILAPPAAASASCSPIASAKWPRWLVANCNSQPSGVS